MKLLMVATAGVSLLVLPACQRLEAQQAVYENFNSGVVRRFSGGSYTTGPLYFPSMAVQYHECPEQTGMIENGMWAERTQDCEGAPYLYWYIMNSYGGWNDWNLGYWRAWMLPGEKWNPEFNRFSFRFRCDYPATFHPGANAHLGTFDKDPAANTGQGESDNYHFYHYFSFNMTPFRWIYATFNDKPQHQRSTAGSWTLKPNPTRFPNYFDYMTKAYIDFQPSATSNWGACYFDDLTFSKTSGEPDWYVSSLTGQYTGEHYEVSWMTPLAQVLQYEVRYSTTGPLKTAGFSSGTDGGTLHSGGGAYTGMYWSSPKMPQANGGLYVGVRPHMIAAGATPGDATVLNIWGHGLAAGDEIECHGFNGLSPASFTTQVTAVGDWQNVTVAQATTGKYTAGGWCRTTSDKSRFTEFYVPPDPATAPMAPVSPSVTGITADSVSLTWIPDPAATSTVIERSITAANQWTAAGTTKDSTYTDTGLKSATSYDYRLRGSNSYGTSGPTQVFTTAVTKSDANAPAIRTRSLPAGIVGTAYSATITAAGGKPPYTFSVISGALPAGLSFSGGAISGTPKAITPQTGSQIRVRVVGSDGAAASEAFAVAVNSTFPVADDLLNLRATAGNWTKINNSQNLIGGSTGVHSYNHQIAEFATNIGWYSSDQWAQAQIVVLPTAGRAGVGVRLQPRQVPWGCVADAANVCLRTANLSGSTMNDKCAGATVNAGDYIRAEVVGSTLTCSLNGTPVVSGKVSAKAGSPGLLTDSQSAILANYSSAPSDYRPGMPPPRRSR